MKILFIVGSLRKGSFNRQIAEKAAEFLQGKATVEFLDYADVPFMNEDIEFPAPESVTAMREKVQQADGLWFFTPEYNHSYSGVLKNAIDWLSRPIIDDAHQSGRRILPGKPAAISGGSGMSGTLCAQDNLVSLLSFLNLDVMNVPRLTIQNVSDKAKDGRLDLADSMPYIERQATAFLEFIKTKIKP
ncbi:MAG: NAD(P)H-dependent oxidoreductase [Oscillospiraceae bacterium]|jgi:chromate reductase|nr:NAD(P)H-dependent oxidoreductase [Oscillospiraceae bacterium]